MLYLKLTTKISYYFLQSPSRSLKTDNQITLHVTSLLQRKTSRDYWNLEALFGVIENNVNYEMHIVYKKLID